jgi:outer membrane protein TolC
MRGLARLRQTLPLLLILTAWRLGPSLPAADAPPPAPATLPAPAPVASELPAPVAIDGRPLPINLATALRLAGARPVVIAAAQASVEVAAAAVGKAKTLWLPNVYLGAGYYRHDGATQGQSGNFYVNSKDQFMAGGGAKATISATDALFAPLAARQVLRSRQSDVETARNEALLAVAEAYFNVQRARGRLSGAEDVVDKGKTLADRVTALSLGQVGPTDVNRALALQAHYQQAVATDREAWRIASANLMQQLRLDPAAVVVPLEPPHWQVALFSPRVQVDALVCVGLTNRPELASQQALVRATVARIRQERIRPLLPSLVLEGNPGAVGPGNYFMGGIFASGAHGDANPTLAREDLSVGLVWGLDGLGLGNRALVRERRAEQHQALIELFRIQDQVAGDVARAWAQLESASSRIPLAENGLLEAQKAYAGSIEGLGKVVPLGDTKVILKRTLDVVDSIQSLARAYDDIFESVADYNTAQFRLYRAVGYPAWNLSCGSCLWEILPVDTRRPACLPPVCAPDPCSQPR